MTTTQDAAARERIHRYFRISLISASLTAVAITVNHLFTLGPVAYAVGAALVVIPGPLFLWFRKTRSNIPIVIYLLLLAWIVVGFGLFGGYWNGLLRLFFGTLLASVSTDFAKPMVGSYAFEASGILTFVGALGMASFWQWSVIDLWGHRELSRRH